MKTGELRLVPKGTKVKSIALQQYITFENDVIVELTDDNNCFCKLKMLLFNIPGYIPTLVDQANGDISVEYSNTTPYQIPTFQMY